MRGAELTLDRVKESQKAAPVRVSRLSDFVSSEEVKELHEKVFKANGQNRKAFDVVDSYIARIMLYFGFEGYRAWKMGEIPDYRMRRLVEAARASQIDLITNLEAVLVATGIAGATSKKAKGPLGHANEIIKKNEKIAKGEV